MSQIMKVLLVYTAVISSASAVGAAKKTTGALVTEKEFEDGVVKNGFPKPKPDQYKNFIAYATKLGKITAKRELAMFLANVIQETKGLTVIVESLTGVDPKSYDKASWDPNGPPPAPGKSGKYLGRGYLQLSYPDNYLAASKGIFGNDKLWKNPELVSQDQTIAWQTAFWFWGYNVHTQFGGADREAIKQGKFGASILAINGALECQHPSEAARNRFKYYGVVLKAFNVNEKPDGSGCGSNTL